jgi:hypothetical protein
VTPQLRRESCANQRAHEPPPYQQKTNVRLVEKVDVFEEFVVRTARRDFEGGVSEAACRVRDTRPIHVCGHDRFGLYSEQIAPQSLAPAGRYVGTQLAGEKRAVLGGLQRRRQRAGRAGRHEVALGVLLAKNCRNSVSERRRCRVVAAAAVLRTGLDETAQFDEIAQRETEPRPSECGQLLRRTHEAHSQTAACIRIHGR